MGAHFQGGVGSVPLRPFSKAPVIGNEEHSASGGRAGAAPIPLPQSVWGEYFRWVIYFQTQVQIYNLNRYLHWRGRVSIEQATVTHPPYIMTRG